ncbi:hypothetical protein PENTCL1PPCAC_16294, partial [Pristionchus entomophagus]
KIALFDMVYHGDNTAYFKPSLTLYFRSYLISHLLSQFLSQNLSRHKLWNIRDEFYSTSDVLVPRDLLCDKFNDVFLSKRLIDTIHIGSNQ